MKPIATEGAPKPIAPYVQGVDAGDLVFVSGQLGIDPADGKVPDDFGAEARRTLANVEAVLEAAGLGMADVVKTTVFMTDFDDYAVMNEAYSEYFSDPPPARSTVKVADLLAGARLEIEAIASRAG